MPPPRRLFAYIGIGLFVGFMSGLFGVGGGVLIVPALVLLLHFEQKRATATSLVGVGPISIAGTIAYAAAGNVDWAVSLFLALGMVAGGIIGSYLLARLHTLVIAWIFLVVLVAIAVSMFFADPVRGAPNPIDALDIVLLVLTGLVVGTISGLVGVGGGIIIVPTLIVFFGLDDLIAKGASLVALVPNALVTSVLNIRRRIGDLVGGLVIGVAGAVTVWPGMLLAEFLDPRAASILFGVFLLLVSAQLAVRTWRRARPRPTA